MLVFQDTEIEPREPANFADELAAKIGGGAPPMRKPSKTEKKAEKKAERKASVRSMFWL